MLRGCSLRARSRRRGLDRTAVHSQRIGRRLDAVRLRRDAQRHNTAETTLSAANVDQVQRRYQATLTASVDSAPVYLSNVSTSGGTKDLLFLLGKNGTLMAIDAADGSVVW